MLVLDPVPVVIEDAEEIEVDVPFSPKNPKMGSHKLKFTPTVYIDRSDFREVCCRPLPLTFPISSKKICYK